MNLGFTVNPLFDSLLAHSTIPSRVIPFPFGHLEHTKVERGLGLNDPVDCGLVRLSSYKFILTRTTTLVSSRLTSYLTILPPV